MSVATKRSVTNVFVFTENKFYLGGPVEGAFKMIHRCPGQRTGLTQRCPVQRSIWSMHRCPGQRFELIR